MTRPERHLVVGGARSGKTRHALQLAQGLAQTRSSQLIYVATAAAGDAEMTERIARHRAERNTSWQTIEAPAQLAEALAGVNSNAVLVVDCLTLWLSNAMLSDFNELQPRAELGCWTAERVALLHWLDACRGCIVMVSNEVGSGIVPISPLARRFQDEQGLLNQHVAQRCEHVTLVVAGIAVAIR